MHTAHKYMKYICRSYSSERKELRIACITPLFYDFVGNIKFACKTIFVEIRIARKSRLFLELHGTERSSLWLRPKITM